jgi:hypothetical protein
MRADLRTPFLATYYSPLFAFDEAASNAQVVERIGLGQVRGRWARAPACCCLVPYARRGRSEQVTVVCQKCSWLAGAGLSGI